MLKKEQIAGANYAYLRCSFEEFVQSMERLGVEHIEMYGASPHLFVFNSPLETARQRYRTLEAAGIDVICFTAEQCMYPVSLSTSDAVVWNRYLAYYMKSLEISAIMKSPMMQMIGGVCLLSDDSNEAWKRCREGIAKVAKRADELGIVITLEADPMTVIKKTEDTVRMINEIGMNNLTGLIDTNALGTNQESIEDAIELLGDKFTHMHFIDKRPAEPCLVPGEGVLPMSDYLTILSKRSYRGYLTPELWGFTYWDTPEEATKRSLEYCWDFIDKEKG